MTITYRLTKGSALSYQEIDQNFRTLDSNITALPDSAQVIGLIYANAIDSARTIGLVDSAYVQARQTTYSTADFVDSAGVSAIIIADVDKAYVDALNVDADTLDGNDGTHYLDYSNFTNTPTIPVQNKANIDALNIDADTLDNEDGTYYLDYDNFTNKPTIPALGTDFVDSDQVEAIVDSAYVQLRQTAQDFAYGSLTGTPTIPTLGTDFVDSDQVEAIVDSAYVQARADTVALRSYTVATLPTGFNAGHLIFVTDGNAGDPTLAVKDSDNGFYQLIAFGGKVNSGGGGF